MKPVQLDLKIHINMGSTMIIGIFIQSLCQFILKILKKQQYSELQLGQSSVLNILCTGILGVNTEIYGNDLRKKHVAEET